MMNGSEKMEKVEVEKVKTQDGFTAGRPFRPSREVGRGELVDKDGSVWSSRDPGSIPMGEPEDQYGLVLQTPEGEREVHSNVLTVMVLGGATAGDLLKRFMDEGLSRGQAFAKIGREYPRVHEDFLNYTVPKQAAKKGGKR